jgi:methyltransferase (TIGR00027 family)
MHNQGNSAPKLVLKPVRRRRKASFTADAACAARAHGAMHADPRLRNPDHLAHHLVAMPFRLLLWPVFRRRFIPEFERRGPGVYFLHQARTKHLDGIVTDEIAQGLGQLVLLGAGFDTRAYRFADRLKGVSVFELDHPLTSVEKQRRLKRLGTAPPANLTFVPIDFIRESVEARLVASGFDAKRRTLFLWEGVTMYVTAEAVDATLALVARTAKGSSIVFDYVHRRMLEAPTPAEAKALERVRAVGEPYRFGVEPDELAPLVARHGLTVASNLDASVLERQYLIDSNGRSWGSPPPYMSIAHVRA